MQLVGKRGGEEVFDSRAALIGAQIAPRGFALTVLVRNTWLAWSNAVRSAASRSFFISIRKCCFDK